MARATQIDETTGQIINPEDQLNPQDQAGIFGGADQLFQPPSPEQMTQAEQYEPNGFAAPEEPAPAASSGEPQIAAHDPAGMPDANTWQIPQPDAAPAFGGSDDSLTAADQQSQLYRSDPDAPGGVYSGGASRHANPLREAAPGTRLRAGSRAGSALGNAGSSDGLLGGGRNARLAGGDAADLGQGEPSDLLLQMLQLLGE